MLYCCVYCLVFVCCSVCCLCMVLLFWVLSLYVVVLLLCVLAVCYVYVVVVLFRCCRCACMWKYFYCSDLYARFLEARSHFRVKQRSLIINSWTMSQPVCQQIDSQHFKINVKTAFVDLFFAYKSTCLFLLPTFAIMQYA